MGEKKDLYIHTNIHTNIHKYTHTWKVRLNSLALHPRSYLRRDADRYLDGWLLGYVVMCGYVWVCMSVYVCMYVYTQRITLRIQTPSGPPLILPLLVPRPYTYTCWWNGERGSNPGGKVQSLIAGVLCKRGVECVDRGKPCIWSFPPSLQSFFPSPTVLRTRSTIDKHPQRAAHATLVRYHASPNLFASSTFSQRSIARWEFNCTH